MSASDLTLATADPFDGLLPLSAGGVTLTAADPGPVWQIAPWPGAEEAAAAALKAAHGVDLPGAGQTARPGGARVLWAGHRQWLMLGEAPDPGLAAHAGLTELTDGWVGLRLTGAGAADVLARLCPLDTRPHVFGVGQTARAELAHLMAQITRTEAGFDLMLMRSFAHWAVGRIADAMASVAAQAGRDRAGDGTASPA